MRRNLTSAVCLAAVFVLLPWGASLCVAQTTERKPDVAEPTRQELLKSFQRVIKDAMEDEDSGGRPTALMNIAAAQFGLGDREGGRKTFEAATQAAMKNDASGHLYPWLRTIAETQRQAGDTDGARKSLELLDRGIDGVKLSVKIRIRIEIARNLVLLGERDNARDKFQESLELLEGFDRDVRAWFAALNKLIVALVSVGELDFALRTIGAIPLEGMGTRAAMLWVVVHEMELASCVDTEKALNRALALSETLPGNGLNEDIFERLAVVRAGRGDLPGALRCVDKLGADITKANTLAEVVAARAQAGDLKGAIETAALIGKGARDPRVFASKPPALSAIAQGQAARGDGDAARSTFDGAVRIARDLEPDFVKSQQLELIAAARAEIGDLEGAVRTANWIQGDDQRKALAFTAIGRAQSKAGQKDKALVSLHRATELLEESRSPANRINGNVGGNFFEAIRRLAGALAEVGSIDEAMKVAGTIEDKFAREQTVSDIAASQARQGDIQGALKTVSQIQGTISRALAFGQIAKAQAESGHAADARVWVDKLESTTLRAQAYKAMVEGLAESKKSTK